MRALFLIPKSDPPRLPPGGAHSPALRSFVETCLQVAPLSPDPESPTPSFPPFPPFTLSTLRLSSC